MIGIVASRLVERFPPRGTHRAQRGELKGLGWLDCGLRPPRWARRLRVAPRRVRRAPGRCEAFDRDGPSGGLRRRVREQQSVLDEVDLRPRRSSTRSCPPAPLRSSWHRSSIAWHPSASAILSRPCWWPASRLQRKHGGGRKALAIPGPPARTGRRLGDRLASARSFDRLHPPFDVAFRLKENRWNETVAPQLVVRRLFDWGRLLRGTSFLARRQVGKAARPPGRRTRGASSPSSTSWPAPDVSCSSRRAFAPFFERRDVELPRAA